MGHFEMRIAFVGVPGSGKSTLAAKVFTELKSNGVNAELVDEVVRRDVQRNGPMRSIWEQYRTRQNQLEVEDAVPKTVDYAVVDSGTLTPYFYAVLYCNHADTRQRLVLQDMHRYLLDDLYLKRYDKVFYLPSGGLIEDGTRFQSAEELQVLDDYMRLAFTRLYKVGNCIEITEKPAKRLTQVMEHLAA